MTKRNSTIQSKPKQVKIRVTDTKSFIARAIEVHGGLYSYENSVYKHSLEKLNITCSIHGGFWQTPSGHLSGKGCAHCSGNAANNRDSFIKKSQSKHMGFYSYGKVQYISSAKKVTITCPIHGDFEQIPESHLSGCGCPRCARIKTGKINSDTRDSFIAKARAVHGDNYTYQNVIYHNSIEHINITCPTHGDFSQSSANHISGHGCSKCASRITARKKTIDFDEVVIRARDRHGDKYNYSRSSFTSAKHKMDIICGVHGTFRMQVSKHISGGNCQKCARESSGHSLTNFKIACSRNNNNNGILYVIECHSKNEIFYKIGITSRSVAKRFKNQSVIPYAIKEVFIVEESSTYIFKLEKRLHRLLARFQHEPSMKFEGHTECFKTIRPIKKLMTELENTNQLQLLA